MLKQYLWLLLLLPTPVLLAASTDVTEKTAIDAENSWCRAFLTGDADAIATIEREDYTLTNSRGAVSTRADDISDAKSGAVHYTVFENHDMKVRLFGDIAIITGRTLVKGQAGETAVDGEFQFTDVLFHSNGRWRAVSGHASRIVK